MTAVAAGAQKDLLVSRLNIVAKQILDENCDKPHWFRGHDDRGGKDAY